MAAVEVRFVGVWRPQRSELSSAHVRRVHCRRSKDEFRRRVIVRAEQARGVENDEALRNTSSNSFLFGKNNVFLILKAVQNGSVGGAQSIIQQMYSLKDIPLLDVSYSVVNEIRKRMAFPWQEENETDSAYGNEQKEVGTMASLGSTQLESPRLSDDHARCLWPRRNDSFPHEESSGAAKSIRERPDLTNEFQVQTNFNEDYGLLSVRDMLFPRCSWPRKESKLARDAENSRSFPVNKDAVAFSMTSVVDERTPREKTIRKSDTLEERDGPGCEWPKISPSASESSEAIDLSVKPESSIPLSSPSALSNSLSPDGNDIVTPMRSITFVAQPGNNDSKKYVAARCAWPRASSRVTSTTHFEEQSADSTPQSAGKTGIDGTAKRSRSSTGNNAAMETGESSITSSHSADLRRQEIGVQSDAGPRCVWPKDRVAGKASEGKKQQNPERAILPSDFPRRMLATSVGISLMNYLLVGQGTSGLANPGDLLQGLDLLPPSKKADLVSK